MRQNHRFILATALVACFVIVWFPGASGIGIRPFRDKSANRSGCSTETKRSGPNCPCKLNHETCNAGTGLQCINHVCVCGPNFYNITVNGVQTCFEKFFVIPSVVVPADSLYGVAVPCNLKNQENIPGLKLKFVGAKLPVYCGADILYITKEDSDDPDELLGEDVSPTTGLVVPVGTPNVSYIGVDINTGDVYLNYLNVLTGLNMGLVINNPDPAKGSYLTETYSGYCIDARGITSPTFSFKVTFSACPNNGPPLG